MHRDIGIRIFSIDPGIAGEWKGKIPSAGDGSVLSLVQDSGEDDI